jgi:hypothetical protein
MRALLAAVGLWCLPTFAYALDVQHIDARFENGEYRLELTAVLDAPRELIGRVVRDYPDYVHLDTRILESRVLAKPQPHVVELYTKLRMCFGPFCRNVKRVEKVEERSNELLATVIPDRSDVEHGTTRTALYDKGGRTELHYSTAIVPKLWIPAFVARPLMLRTLREATLDLFKHVETRAREAPPPPERDEQV